MAWQKPEGMGEYLKATKLCDCDNVKLKEKAKEIIKGAETPKEAALKIFYFVRDDILFGVDYPDVKASQTLEKGRGFCLTKTNLQIALLRAVGIPARCHYVHVSRESHKKTTPRFFYNRLPMVTSHTWCECYLSGEWIVCEALLDKAYYEGTLRKGIHTKEEFPTIDWDGETNLILAKPWIVKDVGTFPSWDDAMIKAKEEGTGLPPSNRLFGWFIFFLGNRRTNDIRK